MKLPRAWLYDILEMFPLTASALSPSSPKIHRQTAVLARKRP